MNDALRRSLAIFGLTGVAAFGVNAAGHAWMLWRSNPLVRRHKATLAYRSALVGDSLLLPLVNVLLDRQLDAWGDGLRPGCLRWSRLARALLVGAGLTALVHGYQGAHKLTNRTGELVRYVMLSNTDDPSVAFYPDSGKIGVWPPGKLFLETDAVDYWVGEA